MSKYSKEEFDTMMDKFYLYVRETASLEEVGDFHLGQVVYLRDQKRWVLIDFYKY